MTERLTKIVFIVLAFAVAGVTTYLDIAPQPTRAPFLGPEFWLSAPGIISLLSLLAPFWCCGLLGLANANLLIHAALVALNSFLFVAAFDMHPHHITLFDPVYNNISLWVKLYLMALPIFAFPQIKHGKGGVLWFMESQNVVSAWARHHQTITRLNKLQRIVPFLIIPASLAIIGSAIEAHINPIINEFMLQLLVMGSVSFLLALLSLRFAIYRADNPHIIHTAAILMLILLAIFVPVLYVSVPLPLIPFLSFMFIVFLCFLASVLLLILILFLKLSVILDRKRGH